MEHKLKTWSAHFEAVDIRLKNFEIRFDDRDFRPQDTLFLCEWDPETETSTGRMVVRTVMAVFVDLPGLKDGYVAMEIR